MSICICGSPRPGEHCHACDVTHPLETADEVKARYEAVLSALREELPNFWCGHEHACQCETAVDVLDRLEALHGLKETP